MGAIRTAAAAEMLGVSASTLRSWERRYGFPTPHRTGGGHRQYELSEIEALRDAIGRAPDATSAVAIAKRDSFASELGDLEAAVGSSSWPARPRREPTRERYSSARTPEYMPDAAHDLRRAFRRFDELAADRAIEDSLHLRALERTIDEVLLPTVELMRSERSGSAEVAFAAGWAARWLSAACRAAPPASRPQMVLWVDSSSFGSDQSLSSLGLELALRRSGVPVLKIDAGVRQSEFADAVKKLRPAALILSGSGLTLDQLGRRVFSAQRAADGELAVFDFHGPIAQQRATGVERLDTAPLAARKRILEVLDEDRPEIRISRGS